MYIILKQTSFNTDHLINLSIKTTKNNTLVLNMETVKETIQLYQHDNAEEYYVIFIVKAIYDCIINKALKVGHPSMNLSSYEDTRKFKKYIDMYEKIIQSDYGASTLYTEREHIMSKLKESRETEVISELMSKLRKINEELNSIETDAFNKVVENLRYAIREGEF